MSLVPKKTVLSNLSNLVTNKPNNNNNNRLHNNIKQTRGTLKRILESSPNNVLKKKNVKKNQENLQNSNINKINDPTRTIESKIKNIVICDENDKKNESSKNSSLIKAVKSYPSLKPPFKNDIPDNNKWKNFYEAPTSLPSNVNDYDKSQQNNIDSEPLYAFDIFQYFLKKEQLMHTEKYMHKQKELSDKMRTVLIDWLVEVQQTFELNHETLYLAVKYIDHFLMRSTISRARFQLLGLTDIFIACKLDVS